MGDLTWTMNCILFGAEIIKLVKEGKLREAKGKIKGLSSEFDDSSVRYLVMRLQQL